MKTKQLAGALIGLVALSLAWYWYDWKLALVILIALTGNNMEISGRK